MPLLEIACFNASSSILAVTHGASRIELCANQSLGGITPSLETLTTFKSHLSTSKCIPIPINIMIRPRGGDFTYTPSEITQMKNDIAAFSAEGVDVDGFVFGALTPEGKIDLDACRELLDCVHTEFPRTQAQDPKSNSNSNSNSNPKKKNCTFHRAFDLIPPAEMEDALESLISLGFTSVLTSGGKENAFEGREVLARLVKWARGRIEIIVGGGVRSGNLEVLVRETGAEAFHSSAVTGDGDVASAEEIGRLSAILKS